MIPPGIFGKIYQQAYYTLFYFENDRINKIKELNYRIVSDILVEKVIIVQKKSGECKKMEVLATVFDFDMALKLVQSNGFEILCYVVISAVVFGGAEVYCAKLKRENNNLCNKQRLLNMHYEAIGIEENKIRSEKSQLWKDINSILNAEVQADSVSAQIAAYLEDVRGQTLAVSAGVYCHDWVVDSILYYGGLLCSVSGIDIKYNFADFNRNGISDEDITSLISCLLASVMRRMKRLSRKERKIIVTTASVVDRLIISVYCENVDSKIRIRHMRALLKKYDGYMTEESLEKNGRVGLELSVNVRVEE